MRSLFVLFVFLAVARLQAADLAQRGEELARKLCVSCHVFPEPELLDKRTWEKGALPVMEQRLALRQVEPTAEGKVILQDWEAIKGYYLEAAPAVALPQAARAEVRTNLARFLAERPTLSPALSRSERERGKDAPAPVLAPGQTGKGGRPAFNTSMVKIHARQIFVGNAETMGMDVLDGKGSHLYSVGLGNPPVALEFRNGGAWITMIGTMAPSETPVGRVSFYEPGTNGWTRKFDVSDRLHRPVHTAFGDLNGDGREDLVVSTFGYISGRFSWFENRGGNQFAERLLIERPGALGSRILDVDGDGKLDVIVAMAQGREGVFVMLNRGEGNFQEFGFFQQHPSWGFAAFQMTDFDGDGDFDIVTANGDNGEFESCPKNYHGIRIYANNGDFEFEEKFFFPMYGAFKAVAADFDLDGDNDIAAIAFFPEFEKAAHESFVYLENAGGMNFKPSTFAQATDGRWITFDTGDLDGDGDTDIVLGALNKTPFRAPKELTDRWETNGVPVMILRNQTRK